MKGEKERRRKTEVEVLRRKRKRDIQDRARQAEERPENDKAEVQ